MVLTHFYAQLGAGEICIGVSQLSAGVTASNLVELDSYDTSLIGKRYVAETGEFQEVPPEPVAEDPRIWWIDVGPFYDRFGPDALAIAASDNGACKAVQTLTGVRKYIWLKDPRVAAMIDMLIATNQPEAQPFAPGSGPMTLVKKAAILETPTTEYERHIKGLGA